MFMPIVLRISILSFDKRGCTSKNYEIKNKSWVKRKKDNQTMLMNMVSSENVKYN